MQVDSNYFTGPVYSSEDSGEIRACAHQESNLEDENVGVPDDSSEDRVGYVGWAPESSELYTGPVK